MNELIYKDNLTIDEIEKIDFYLDQHIEEAMELNNKDIIRIIEKSEELLGYSLLKITLEDYLFNLIMNIRIIFDETKLNKYLKYVEIINYFKFNDYGLNITLGDYYFNIDKKISLKYYEIGFSEGFNLAVVEYYKSVINYVKLLSDNYIKILIKLIKKTKKEYRYCLDFIKVYSLVINNLGKENKEYIKYLDDAIKSARLVVKKYRQDFPSLCGDDSDEERELCNLISLKFEHYVSEKKYVKAYQVYEELTIEINTSNCRRYYKIRDKLYHQMILNMSEEYSELKFFEDQECNKFEIIENIENIKDYLNQTITLKNSKGLDYKFKITFIYKEENITLVPILPIIGEGGKIFLNLKMENDKMYLINK